MTGSCWLVAQPVWYLIEHLFLLAAHLCRPMTSGCTSPSIRRTQPEAHPRVLCHVELDLLKFAGEYVLE
jgi:hypothetical protein